MALWKASDTNVRGHGFKIKYEDLTVLWSTRPAVDDRVMEFSCRFRSLKNIRLNNTETPGTNNAT